MSKKVSRALASGMVISLVLTTALSSTQVRAAAGQVTRTSGSDRYATAAQVATTNWSTGATDVVLVSGEGYADAVSASALAKKLNAPILLTTSGSLNYYAKSALETLKPTNVYVVGGNASVSQSIRAGLRSNYNLIELQGANRYETNVAVANKLVELGVSAGNVLLVGGQGFSDALSVAPVAAAKGQILLLGNNDASSMTSVVNFVKSNNSSATVVGTTNVINESIYNKLGAVERVNGGTTRFQTNINVLNRFDSELKADKLYVANASGDGYADALVASALAGKTASPLVLVDTEDSYATTEAISYIKAKATKTTDLNVIGGSGVVSNSTVDAINYAVNPTNNGGGSTTNGDNTVSSIEPISLNQFDIAFNTNVDEDTAELTSNYKVAGTQLTDKNAHVELINDNTVRVTLVKSEFDINQGDEKTVSVKKGVLTENKTETIETYSDKIEFKDITAPTIKNVSVRGNNKLVVEFSEAVNMSSLSKVAALIKVDGKTLSNYNTTYSEVKEAATNGSQTWASKVEFYLNSGLDSGDLTVKIKDADNGVLVDAAGFSFKEADETIDVDDVDTEPEIQDITCSDDGELKIRFDRPMDTKTALNEDYYQINEDDIDGATLEFEDDDTVVKITHIPDDILEDNTNILSMTDSVKDAYGNKMDDDTRKSFDKDKDETKPEVLSATVIDSKTLRVQFSEDVKYAYATNEDNYELRNSNNVDLMTKSGVYIEASSSVDEDDKADTDTYDIKFDKSSYKLNSSKYTLYVENIIDKASDPNRMDDQTITVDGDDDTSTSVDDIEAFRKSDTEVAIYFDSEMDSSSISDKDNYYYINGEGESEDLPDDVDITVSTDNKGVVIDFDDANKTVYTTSSAPSDEDAVKRIGIKNVLDYSGNEVYPGALTIGSSSSSGPELEENTFKLYKDGDDVKAEFQLDTALDTINPSDFKVSGIECDDADFDDETVTLTFNEDSTADAIMALGSSAVLQISKSSSDPSEDIGGRTIQNETQKLYYNEIAPETDRDNYSSTATIDSAGAVTSAVVNITMKTPVDTDILGSYKDDFIFTNSTEGKNLDISSVALDTSGDEPTLVFTIKNANDYIEVGDKIDITATSDDSDIDLRSEEDEDGNNAKFVPTSDDYKVKTVKVTSASEIIKTTLNTSIATAGALTKADYTATTWAAMQTKLTAAQTVAASSLATQTKVYTAQTELDQAVANLVSIKALNTSIATAEALTEADYTATTWATMKTKLTAAATVVANADATKTEVTTAQTELDEAVANLVSIKALNNSIATAQAKVEVEYTASSWSAMKAKLTEAQNLSATATQAEVDAAKDALDVSVEALASAATDTFVTAAQYTEELFSSNLYVTVADATKVTGVTVNGTALVLEDKYTIVDGKVKIIFKKGIAKDAIGTVVIKTADKDYTVSADMIK
jgi:Putative cell wall-binding domain